MVSLVAIAVVAIWLFLVVFVVALCRASAGRLGGGAYAGPPTPRAERKRTGRFQPGAAPSAVTPLAPATTAVKPSPEP